MKIAPHNCPAETPLSDITKDINKAFTSTNNRIKLVTVIQPTEPVNEAYGWRCGTVDIFNGTRAKYSALQHITLGPRTMIMCHTVQVCGLEKSFCSHQFLKQFQSLTICDTIKKKTVIVKIQNFLT